MTQKRLNVAPAGEPADADSFDPGGSVGDVLTKLAPPAPGQPPAYGWRTGAKLANLSAGLYVDSGTSVAVALQSGNIEQPFGTLHQAAAALLTMVASNAFALGIVSGDYSTEPALTIDPAVGTRVSLAPEPGGSDVLALPYVLPAITYANPLFIQGALCVGSISGGEIFLVDTQIADNGSTVTSGTNITLRNVIIYVVSGGVPGSVFTADSALFNAPIHFGGTAANMSNCRFSGLTVFTFTGAAGVLTLDGSTYASFLATGSSVVNGTVVVLNSLLRARISVVVPAILAPGVDYVDVSTVGTALAGIAANAPVTANPTADLAAAGAGNGGFINARVSAANTIRCAFLGTLAGGAVDFVFASGG
jgi:hypothetical protein